MTASRFTQILRATLTALFTTCCAGYGVAASGGSVPDTLAWSQADREPARPALEAVRLAQGSCSAAAAEAAAQTGGQVLSVSMSQKGERTVCIVTVLIPGHDGSRPRRATISVPL